MQHATRTLLHRWYRECRPPDGTQRRRALLARSRRERATKLHATLLAYGNKRLTVENTRLQRRNNELADLLKALQDRVPVYARIQHDERLYGRTFVIPVTLNPDAIVRGLLGRAIDRDQQMDLLLEFHYLADFASRKIVDLLQTTAAEQLGMPTRGPTR